MKSNAYISDLKTGDVVRIRVSSDHRFGLDSYHYFTNHRRDSKIAYVTVLAKRINCGPDSISAYHSLYYYLNTVELGPVISYCGDRRVSLVSRPINTIS